MLGFNDQEEMLKLIGKTLKKRVNAYVVGGSAMLFYNFSKTVTKDVDMVMFSRNEMEILIKTLEKLGFKTIEKPSKEGHPIRMQFRDFIFDVFLKRIFRLKVSEKMKDRSREMVEFGNLSILVASPEDIILTKSMTDREGDRSDVSDIIKEMNVNWETILDEVEWQSKENPNVAFGVYLFDFLEDLSTEWKADIPREVIKKVTAIYEKRLDNI